MRRLSIKARVTLLCTLLAAGIAAAALVLLLAGEARTVQQYYRDTLTATARLAKDEIFYRDGELEIDRNLDELPGVNVAVFSIDGDLIYGRVRFEKAFVHGRVERAGGWMVYDEQLAPEGGGRVWLRCFLSTDLEVGVQGGWSRLVLLILPAMVLLGGAGGFLIARRAFRPVAQIVRTAESIADGDDLKKRIGFTGARDELHAMAAAFDGMFERLDGAFERERRFTSDASHELRTPVAGILAQSEFALSGAATDADRLEALEEIRRRAGDMSGLIGRLLTLSRLDAKRLRPELEDVDLGLTAQIAADSMEDAACGRGVSVTVSGAAAVRADQMMAVQAVMNLIGNAIVHGREGGSVQVEVYETEADARVRVSDDGPGIAPEALPHLFERFWQADPSHGRAGAGLGLPLVERIMQLHGGRVEVESGAGARFTLIFPKEVDG